MPPKKIAIEKLDLNVDLFKNKTTLLLGVSGSGKSKLIIDMLYKIKEDSPVCYIFSPTSDTFKGIIPKSFINYDVQIDLLENIYKTQEKRVEIYKTCNNKERLAEIALKLNNSITDHLLYLKYKYIETKKKLEESNEEHKIEDLNDAFNNNMIKILKDHIIKSYNEDTKKNLNEEEINIIKMMNMNIGIVLVFDDCAANSKTWGKSEILRTLFYQGRHAKITTIISLQNDKDLSPAIRQNAFITFFTTQVAMKAYFDTISNAFTKDQKKRAEIIGKEIFKKENRMDTFKKACYMREQDTIYYYKASLYPKFKYNEELFRIYEKSEENTEIKLTNDFIKSL